MSIIREVELIRTAKSLASTLANMGELLRLIGGMAFWESAARSRLLPGFARQRTPDLDFVTYCSSTDNLVKAFALNGFIDPVVTSSQHGFRLQLTLRRDREEVTAHVYASRIFRFNHPLALTLRGTADRVSLNPTDLLITKLAIHELTEKDYLDCAMLLNEFGIEDSELKDIDVARIASLCSVGWRSWGLHKDVYGNLSPLRSYVQRRSEIVTDERRTILTGLGRIEAALEASPKSVLWRARALLGDRVRWWDEMDDSED